MIGTALIGCGYWGSILKKYVDLNPDLKLLYICNSKTDLNVVFNDPLVKAVVVATPMETHYPIVKAALQHGKHVLSEKPLALKSTECAELAKLAKKENLVLLVDYVYLFSKALKKAISVILSKRLGKLISVEMSVKHLGRFGVSNVYWLLASHMLSILGSIAPLSQFDFKFNTLVPSETGSILFTGPFSGRVDVSLNYPWKETLVTFYLEHGTIQYNPNSVPSLRIVQYEKPIWIVASKIPQKEETFPFNEQNNLQYVVKSFVKLIGNGGEGNAELATDVTCILEGAENENSVG